jgi:hypothetical protein
MCSSRPRRLWLALAPLLVCIADQVVTLSGQTAEYWAGDYSAPHEGSPQGYWLLQQHPLAYIAAAAGYMLTFTIVILLLPRLLAQTLAVGLVLGHAWGTASWLYTRWPGTSIGYWMVIGLYTVAAMLIVAGIEMSQRGK